MEIISREKNILWVTHDFPPRRSSGIYRPVKIYKYIDKNKFKIHFLTQSPFLEKCVIDPTLMKDLKPLPTITRIPNITIDGLISGGHALLKRKKQISMQDKNSRSEQSGAPQQRSLKMRLYHVFMMIVYMPDQYFIWGLIASLRALLLHWRKGFHLVYTTSHPQSGHLPGLLLSRLGVKWVVDYRDGGILYHRYLFSEEYPKGKLRTAVERWYQRSVLNRADHVIIHSKGLKEAFMREFSVDCKKITDISNGFDEEDFVSMNKSSSTGPELNKKELVILHVGTWYLQNFDVNNIINILNGLSSDMRKIGIKLIFISLGSNVFSKFDESTLDFQYKFVSSVTHDKVPEFLALADLYFLAISKEKNPVGFLPGKLWEYLRGGKPILFYGDKEDSWDVISECSFAHCIDSSMPANLSAKLIYELMANHASNSEIIQKHSWGTRSQSFEKVFFQVMQ